ncbi:hypothetical protein FRACYDRAFT_267124 [Fragilariopsis cylindrus CCMP1102]|uniref:Uncharacterized protein n=1 Tax=Fragilariopsis cylindrus CCMP1102 TaxID=635003 RepID=A0A1E7FV48_9STRA|nr:hypothetical protein FRACYDRAFT_267124 [Fragilariopsis cylindrus CCMP1102]|eukprot:OEU22019.1 hypothetical protein FRACYDRAFT_267124 [Fragilariopsis cylindrus CCMP1102]
MYRIFLNMDSNSNVDADANANVDISPASLSAPEDDDSNGNTIELSAVVNSSINSNYESKKKRNSGERLQRR